MNKAHKSGKPNPRFIVIERRQKVLGLLAQGLSESEIAGVLKVSQPTLSRDVTELNRAAQEIIKTIEKDYYPLQLRSILDSLRQVLKKSWQIINDKTESNKLKINAMKLVIDASRTKFDILLNGPVNLNVIELHQRVQELIEQQEEPRGFMPPLLGPPNLEDLK